MERETSKILEELGGHRCRRKAAIPDHPGGYALPHLRLGAAVVPEPPIRVRVHVDEAGGENLAGRVQVPDGGLAVQVADRRDLVVLDPDVRAAARAAAAIDDLRALDLQVKHGRVG
jgi:hypothetical protein